MSQGPAVFRFDPKNESQQRALDLYDHCDVLFLLGPAGTGKTHCALGLAAKDLLSRRGRKSVLVCRPAVEAGRPIGFLPGDYGEKINPHFKPTKRLLQRMGFPASPDNFSFEALSYLRGETYEHTVMVLDETQNTTQAEFRLFVSRMGRGSKVLCCGDPSQSDLGSSPTTLGWAVDRLRGLPGVGVVEFAPSENLRHPFLARYLALLG